MKKVEIWSDFLCPFCYIGKNQFEKALMQFDKKDQIEVVYKSFELDTEAKKSQKISIYQMLAAKYGQSEQWAKQMNDQLAEQAKQYGLVFKMDLIKPTNSFDAHRLSLLAETLGLQNQVMNDLFAAYFQHGKDIADLNVLQNIALQNGMSREAFSSVFDSDQFSNEVRAYEEEAYELDIRGVPFFIFDRKFALSGAQPVEVFLESLQEIVI